MRPDRRSKWLAWLLATLVFAAGGAEAATFAFSDVNVLIMDREEILASQTVVVRDGTIVAVGPKEATPVPEGARRIDGEGRLYVMPGLADMHVHLRRDGAAWLPLYLAAGVTTVLNMGGTENHLDWRRQVADGDLVGPTIYTAGPQIGRYKPLSPEDAARLVRDHKRAGYDFVKLYSSSPGDWSREAYARVIETAATEGIAVTGHAPRNLPFDVVLDSGRQSIAHTEEILYTHFHNLDTARIADFARRAGAAGLSLITTFATFENIARQWGKPEVAEAALKAPRARYLHYSLRVAWKYGNPYSGRRDHGDWIEKALAFHTPLIAALHDQGVRLIAGSDAPLPVLIPGFAIHREIEILTEAGLSPFEALSTATRNAGDYISESIAGAEAFGRVAPGFRADLLLLADNPLENLSLLEKPLGTLARGRWYPRARLDSLLDAMATDFAKPRETIETADGARLTGEDMRTLLPGGWLSGRNDSDETYDFHLAPDGKLTEVTGPLGDRVLTGSWRIEGDKLCRRSGDRAERCLAGVQEDDSITWYLDVGGWFKHHFIKFREEILAAP